MGDRQIGNIELSLLRCPATGERLQPDGEYLVAETSGNRYPTVDGKPVLIADERSLFRQEDFQVPVESDPPAALPERLLKPATGLLRDSQQPGSAENLSRFAGLVSATGADTRKRVLVIGGGTARPGLEALDRSPDIDLVETDVYFGPRNDIVCDGHDLPFAEATFDGVLTQWVLEHVLDPWRVVDEIHRVLKPGGLVYSEVPFVQQVHEGAFDFTRFTELGHRRLYRRFDEIWRGVVAGPTMAFSWSARYLLASIIGPARRPRTIAGTAVKLVTRPLIALLDPWLVRRPGASDAAAGTGFLGRRREDPIDDRELVRTYSGAVPTPMRWPSRGSPATASRADYG